MLNTEIIEGNRFGEYPHREKNYEPTARRLVNSHGRISIENSGKFRQQPFRENAFAAATGGESGRNFEPETTPLGICFAIACRGDVVCFAKRLGGGDGRDVETSPTI